MKSFVSVLQTENRDNLSMQFIYKSMVDLAEMRKAACSPTQVLSIIIKTCITMIFILITVKDMKTENTITVQFLVTAEGLANMFAPALCAEVLATQNDKIALILLDKFMQEPEPSRRRELERFIRYVEARALRFRLYTVIPLDASLLGMVLSFIVTYLIVIIQFTYK